jgi:hypothetical protein
VLTPTTYAINNSRELANQLADAALYEHEALDQWRDLSRFVPKKPPGFIDKDGDGFADDDEGDAAADGYGNEDATTNPATSPAGDDPSRGASPQTQGIPTPTR